MTIIKPLTTFLVPVLSQNLSYIKRRDFKAQDFMVSIRRLKGAILIAELCMKNPVSKYYFFLLLFSLKSL